MVRQLAPFYPRIGDHEGGRPPIPHERKIAAAIWYLATGESYRELDHRFAMGKSTIRESIVTFTNIVIRHFGYFIQFPTTDRDRRRTASGFRRLGFQHAIGALDCSHVEIMAPAEGAADYFNRKCYYSIIIQGISNAANEFIDIHIGWTGSAHDARVFYSSPMFDRLESGILG
jgi:hypothetical protein